MSAVSEQWVQETVGAISQVAEPYRSNLLQWLEEGVGCNGIGESPEARLTHLEQQLVEWLSGLRPMQAAHNQEHIATLIRVSAVHFSTGVDEALLRHPLSSPTE